MLGVYLTDSWRPAHRCTCEPATRIPRPRADRLLGRSTGGSFSVADRRQRPSLRGGVRRSVRRSSWTAGILEALGGTPCLSGQEQLRASGNRSRLPSSRPTYRSSAGFSIPTCIGVHPTTRSRPARTESRFWLGTSVDGTQESEARVTEVAVLGDKTILAGLVVMGNQAGNGSEVERCGRWRRSRRWSTR